ncbi:hypothetical protein NMY22_g14462 [Coprinellus aureogranulatus]|nr:hypothetical protein NMY22_g14462 [Coprinellus aureogranulatus]
MILYHLGQLTLPALEDLEVRESSIDIVDNFYESIVQLVVRSGCSLKRLALDEKIPFTTKTDPSFRQQAELWRELTHIDVRCPPGRDIQSLGSHVLGPGTFTFPYLEVMTLRRHVLERRRRLPNDQTVHPMMLLSVLRSRTSDLSQQTSPLRNDAGSTEFKPLREVVFVYTEPPIGVLSWRLNQLEAFEASGQLPFGDTDVEPNTVELWAKELDQFFKISYSSSRVHINFLGQRAMSALLKQMEELNLEGKRSQILVVSHLFQFWGKSSLIMAILQRRGVVRLLHLASLKKDGTVPGDGIFRFRKRARDLCEKWKPFLLRDHRSSPYRLSSTATRVAATLRIKYVPAGSRDDTDEEAWKDILALDVNE